MDLRIHHEAIRGFTRPRLSSVNYPITVVTKRLVLNIHPELSATQICHFYYRARVVIGAAGGSRPDVLQHHCSSGQAPIIAVLGRRWSDRRSLALVALLQRVAKQERSFPLRIQALPQTLRSAHKPAGNQYQANTTRLVGRKEDKTQPQNQNESRAL